MTHACLLLSQINSGVSRHLVPLRPGRSGKSEATLPTTDNQGEKSRAQHTTFHAQNHPDPILLTVSPSSQIRLSPNPVHPVHPWGCSPASNSEAQPRPPKHRRMPCHAVCSSLLSDRPPIKREDTVSPSYSLALCAVMRTLRGKRDKSFLEMEQHPGSWTLVLSSLLQPSDLGKGLQSSQQHLFPSGLEMADVSITALLQS